MKAKRLAEILLNHPELEVMILEGGKHIDNIPALNIRNVEVNFLDDADLECITILTDPNPETELKVNHHENSNRIN